jgi:transposase-like protein
MPQFVPVEELFKGRHFDREIVVLCVRWYLSFKLSYRDLVALMGERGIGIAHTTILRWGQHYTPEFEKRWSRFARTVGGSWRMDETYIKVRGEWIYLYRAVDKAGKTVDFHLSRKRDGNAAKAFLRKAMKGQRTPTKITLDAYAASHRAVAEWKGNGELPKCVPAPHRTGSPARQTTAAPDAGTEELADGGGGNQWHRAGREDQEETVSDEQAWRTHGNDAGDLGKGPGCITGTTRQPTEQHPSNLT